MEDYDKIKKVLALGFVNYLDKNRPEGKMCLSNGECTDIEKAVNEQDWPKLVRYLDKYRESEEERMMREFNDWLCEEIECRTNDLRDEKDQRTLNMLCYVLTKVKDWLEKQKEPKQTDLPAGFYYIDLKGNRYYSKEFRYGDMKLKVGEQKPVEWSEQDEKMRYSILAELANHICYNKPLDGMPSGTGWTSYKYQQEMDWLTNRLKSLRPGWKTTEEQMEALLNTLHPDDPYYVELKSLYEQLKQLKKD